MATLDYNLGTPLGPDPRAVADLAAIDTYVRTTARDGVKKYPKSLPLIEDYEKWRQAIGYFDMMVMVNDTMRTAKAKRDAINIAQGAVISPGTHVEPGAFITSPEQSEPHPFARGIIIGVIGAVAAWFGFRYARKRVGV